MNTPYTVQHIPNHIFNPMLPLYYTAIIDYFIINLSIYLSIKLFIYLYKSNFITDMLLPPMIPVKFYCNRVEKKKKENKRNEVL